MQKTYSYYLNINASAMAYLVGEDLNDTKFYEHILKWYIRQKMPITIILFMVLVAAVRILIVLY